MLVDVAVPGITEAPTVAEDVEGSGVTVLAVARRIVIRKGEPICRVIPVRRDVYFTQQMSPAAFDEFFARGQRWLATHGQAQHEGTVDITRTYVKQQLKSKFIVLR